MKNLHPVKILSVISTKQKALLKLLSVLFFFITASTQIVSAQNLTQSGFTGSIVPQYMGSGNTTRLPIVFRATVSGLTASTTYRYYTQAAASATIGTASSGAGNPLLISSSGSTYTYTTSPGLSTAGTYETFTTDGSGSYTGWFGFVNTGNAIFAGGATLYPTLTLNAGGTGTTVSKRLALDKSITVLAFATTSGANNGSFIQQTSSSATAKNLVALYDNTAGTGRPLAVTVVESTGATIASVVTGYSTTSGAWNTIVPNTNANGVRRIEQLSVTTGNIVGCATDADGTWATGSVNTTNPISGTTAIAISSTDAPLSSCGTSTSPTITGAATTSAFTTTYGTNSSAQSFTISGSNLTADITATAPTGFEVSTDGTTYSGTVTFTQSSGSASGTLYIRIKATAAAGSYNSQNIVLSSTGASSVNITTPASGNTVSTKGLTITGITANNKTYDATTTATLSGTASYSGLVNSESFSVTGTASASFATASVGTNKAITVSGYTTPSANYSITQPTGLTANIIAKSVTISGLSANNKVYDGSTVATLSGSAILSGVISADASNVSLSAASAAASFVSSSVANNVAVVVTGYSLIGTASSNYTISQPTGLSANITAKSVTITGISANDKTYDGTTDATLSGTPVLSGVVSSDISNVSISGTPVAVFASAAIGTNISVSVTGYTISGSASANYVLQQISGLSANITAAALQNQTINFSSLNAVTYGDASITITGSASSGLDVSYSSSNTLVATVSGNTVTIVGAGSTIITATQSGNNAYNPAPSVSQTLVVNKKQLTVINAVGVNKVYDATSVATVTGFTLNGVIGSDIVSTTGNASFADANVGNNKSITTNFSLTGSSASNYSILQPSGLTANITPALLSVTGLTANNKIYDATTTASINGTATLNGVLASDINNVILIGLPTANFTVTTVGNNITVNVIGYSLSGSSASNYDLNPVSLSANITAKNLSITGLVANNKVYDGNTSATLSGTEILNGVISGDQVSLNIVYTASFNTASVGTNKPITVTGYNIYGQDASNYTISQPTGLTANITTKSITVTGITALNKEYDGNTTATISGTGVLVGLISGDVVNLSGSPIGTFASASIGTGISVTITGYSISGSGASNYAFSQPALTADILTPGATFHEGNIIVLQVGSGSGTLGSSSTPLYLKEYSSAGSLLKTKVIPSTGTDALTLSGSATSEGGITRSTDGQSIIIPGYNAASGVASIASSTSASYNRAIAKVNFDTSYSLASKTTSFSGNNARGATSDGTNYWGVGSGSGVVLESSGTGTVVSSSFTNNRYVNIFNGQLYISGASGGLTGIAKVGTGTPTNTGNTSTQIINTTVSNTSSPYGFSFNAAGNVAYIADDAGTNASTAGIQKWVYNSGTSTWSLAYKVDSLRCRGLVVDYSNANASTGVGAVIYATDAISASANKLYKVIDSGFATTTRTTIATASPNTAFRGVVFSPVPLPTVVSPSVTNITANSANFNAVINYTGTSSLTSRGTCLKTTPGVTITDNKLAEGGIAIGNYTQNRTLSPETKYYIKGYASTLQGDGLSSELSFFTLSNPPVTQASSLTATPFSSTQIELNWGVADYASFGSTAKKYLLLRATAPNVPVFTSSNGNSPTVDANTTIVNANIDGLSSSASATGLLSNTEYNFLLIPYTWNGTDVATYNYLTTGAPTANGTTSAFDPAVLTNTTATSITNNSAILGATILSDGGAGIADRGTVYNTSSPVVISNNTLSEGGLDLGTYAHLRSDLQPQTKYYYAGYVVTNGGSISLSPEANFYTYSNPPVVNANGLSATAFNGAQINLSWTSAVFPTIGATVSGYVLIRADYPNTPTLVNVNGQAPIAGPNTTIVNASILGTATSAISTGLTGNTQYNFVLIPYTYDGTNVATYNYLYAGSPSANGTTLAPMPAAQPTRLAFSNISCNSASLTWNKALGSLGYIVLQSSGINSPNTDPASGTTYSQGDIIGNASVVYVGNDSSTVVNGLSDLQKYNYKVYSYNSDNPSNISYLTDYPLQGSFNTNIVATPIATAASNVYLNSFDANWNASNCSNGYRIDVSTSPTFSTGNTLTIASENFENGHPLFSETALAGNSGIYYSGNTSSSSNPANSPYVSNGTYSFGITNSKVQLTSSSMNTSLYEAPVMSFNLASISNNSTSQGADATDSVIVEISKDSGNTWSKTLTLRGNNNAYWSFSGTGSASTPYDQDSYSVDFAAPSANNNSNGQSTISITGLPSVNNLQVRITLMNNQANELWLIDNFSVTGKLLSCVSPYNNLAVSALSKTVSGLSSNTAYYYRVRSTGINSYSSNSNVIAVTTSSCNVSVSANSNAPICDSSTLQLTSSANGNFGAITYSWSGPGGFVSNVQNPSVNNASAAQSGLYVVTVTDSLGCTATNSTNVVVNQKTSSTTYKTVCAQLNVENADYPYFWNGTYYYNSGTYTVHLTNAAGCDSAATLVFSVHNTPTVSINNITGTTVLTCATPSINVSAVGGVSYIWTNGLGTNPNATITNQGNYTVTVTDQFGCYANSSIFISANNTAPIAGIDNNTGSSQINCATPSISVTATGGASYSWSNGLGNNADATITSAGTYTATVIGANGCSSTSSITITSNTTLPTASIINNTGTTVLTCAVSSISVTATGGVSYSWSNGLGNNASAAITTPGVYTVTVTGANGCSSTANITITSNTTSQTAGITNITGTTELNCTTTSINVTATGGGSYSWNNGLGSNASQTIAAPGVYVVTVTGSNGCTSSASISITSNTTIPTASIDNNTNVSELNCNTTSISLSANGGGTYSWNNGLGTNPDQTITLPGTYIVTVTGANGCTSTASTVITSNTTAPVAAITNITGATELNCTRTSINVTATGGVSYLWSNGLGTQASQVFTSAGTYTVAVTGSNGCTSNSSIIVTSNTTLPTATITNNSGTTELTCAVASINLTASGGNSYIWSNGLGNNSNAIVTNPGTYIVTVTGLNGCSNNQSINITSDKDAPTASIVNNTGSSVITCSTSSISVTATGGVSYSWNNGLGSDANATITSAGTYTVTVTGANGCTSTSSIVVTSNLTAPVAVITNNSGTSVITCSIPAINVTASGGLLYSWSGGLGNSASTSITQAGSYSVIVTGANGCTSTANIVVTTNNVAPIAGITNNSNNTVLTCATPTVNLTATGGGSYSWNNGLGESATVNLNTAGTYVVTVSSANGCSSTASVTITSNTVVPNTSIINNSGTSIITCNTSVINLTATGGVSYSWDNGLGNTASVSITSPGTYTVTATGANGCTSTASVTITSNLIAPTASITSNTGVTQLTCSVTSISLTATGGSSYSWDNGLGFASAATVTSPGTYSVTVTGANGCTSNASITVTSNTTAPTAGITNNTGGTQLTCAIAAINVTATGGGTYSWNNNLGNNASVSIVDPGTYTVTVTSENGCSSTSSIIVTQGSGVPTVGYTASATTICAGTSVTLSGTGANTYSWSGGISNGVSFVPTSTTTYTVTGFITGSSCSNTASVTIIVNPLPTGTISGSTSICTGASANLSIAVTGNGPWSGTLSDGTAFSGSTSPIAVSVNPTSNTTYTIASLTASSCAASSLNGNAIVTINNFTVDTIVGSKNACIYSGTSTLNATYSIAASNASSYVWTVPTGATIISGAGTNTLTVHFASTFTTGTLSVVVSSSCGTPVTKTAAITKTLSAAPATLTGPASVCSYIGTTTQATYTAGVVTGAIKYSWTLPTTVTIVSATSDSSSINVTFGVAYVTSTFSVKAVVGCGTTAAKTLSVAGTTTAPIAGTAPTRCGAGLVSVSATPGAGETIDWYSAATAGTLLRSGSLTFDSTYTTTGVKTVYAVSRSTANGCVSATRTAVTATINALPTAVTVSVSAAICGAGTVTLSATAPASTTLSWFADSSTTGTVLATGTTFTTPVISATTKYFVASQNTAGCYAATLKSATATINDIPGLPTVTTTQSRCGVGSITLTATAPTGSAVWFRDATTTTALTTATTATVTYATPATSASDSTYYVASKSTAGCFSARTAVLAKVLPLANAPLAVNASRCGAGNITVSATPGAGETIDWYSAATAGTLLRSGSLTLDTNVTTANKTFYAAARNTTGGCVSATRTAVVATYNALPTAVTVSVSAAICGAGTVALSATAPASTTLSWFADSATTGTVLATGTSFTTPVISATTKYFVASQSAAGCYAATLKSATATINAVPDLPTVNTTQQRCGAGSITLTATAPTGSAVWFRDATTTTALTTATTATVTYATPATSASDSTYYVASKSTVGCFSARTAVLAKVLPLANAPLAVNASRCGAGNITVSATPGAGETIDWYSAATAGTLLRSGSLTLDTNVTTANKTFYAAARNTTAGCVSATRTAVVATYNALPTAVTVSVSGSACGANAVNLSATAPASTTLSWFADSSTTGTVLATGTTFTTPVISVTTKYFVASQSAAGCYAATLKSATATINAIPGLPTVNTTQQRCGTGAIVLTATAPTGSAVWFRDATTTTALTTATTATVTYSTPATSAADSTYYVATKATTGCFSARTAVLAKINAVPSAPTTTGTSVCGAARATVSAATTVTDGTIDWYSATTAGTLLRSGSLTFDSLITATKTFYALTRVTTTGCVSATRTAAVATFNALLAAPTTLTGTTSICPILGATTGTTYTTTAVATATSYLWTIPAGAAFDTAVTNGLKVKVKFLSASSNDSITVQAVGTTGCAGAKKVLKLITTGCATTFVKSATAAPSSMSVNVFPNPTTSSFNVQVLTAGKESITARVLDMQGRQIKTITINPYETINIGTELKAGSYIIEVRQGKNIKTVRMMKF